LGSAFHIFINSGFSIAEAMNIHIPDIDNEAIIEARSRKCDCEEKRSTPKLLKLLEAERRTTGNPDMRM
jgi:hypothetical protein